MEVATSLRFTRSSTLKRVAPLFLAVVVAALLLAVVLRDTIERAVVTGILQRATGLSIDAGDVANVPGGVALTGFRGSSEKGDLTLAAPRLVLTRSASGYDVELDGAEASAVEGSWALPLQRADEFARRFLGGANSLTVRLHNCSLSLSGSGAPAWQFAFRNIEGTLRRQGRATSYDLSGALADDSGSYPFAARFRSGDLVSSCPRGRCTSRAGRSPVSASRWCVIRTAFRFRSRRTHASRTGRPL
jgi:hypothetical protein